jgi:hypothetical protein
MLARDPRAAESTHWYTRDGAPMYTVPSKKDGSPRNTTLRDARELNLIPSVTTILNIAAKPGLTVWLQEQAILAALTLPRDEDEPESVWLKRVVQDSKQQAKDAADKGTEIHEAIQSYYEGKKESKYPFHVSSCVNIIKSHYGDVKWVAEQSFGHELGFGGKCDMHTTDAGGIVIDIKTKEFTDVTKPLWYLLQIAAYRVGLGIPTARCANVFVSRTDPELAVVKEWEEDDLQRGWEMFTHLLAYWQLKNQHE